MGKHNGKARSSGLKVGSALLATKQACRRSYTLHETERDHQVEHALAAACT